MPHKTNSTSLQAILRKSLKAEEEFLEDIAPTDFISTGIPSVDYTLGRPGVACGRVTVIRGAPSSGKSSLLYSLIAETQRRDGVAILMETEEGIERSRLETLGVNFPDLIRLQPSCVEETLNKIGEAIEQVREHDEDVLTLIAWDSVAATPTRKELESDSGEAVVALHARLIGAGLRKYTALIAKKRIALVIVNQFREKIGGLPFADNKTMIADNPLRFHASVVLDLSHTGAIRLKAGAPIIGEKTQIEVSKNKLGPPKRRVTVPFLYKTGWDISLSWLDLAEQAGVVKKSGAWYTFPDGAKLQLRAAGDHLLRDVALQEQVRFSLEAQMIPPAEDEENDEFTQNII